MLQSLCPAGLADNQLSSQMMSFQATKDFEEQAELLRGWNQGYAQLSSGGFEGYVSEIRFDDLHLFLEYSSQSLLQNGYLADDVIAVGMPLQFSGNGLFCGTACDHDSMHIFSGNSGFEFFSPTQLVMAGISVKRDALLKTLNAEDAELVGNRARVDVIQQQQIQHGQQLRPGKVQAAVGHGAVTDLQQRPEHDFIGACMCGTHVEEAEHHIRSLDASADFEETPAVAAGHVFLLHAAESREIEHQGVE